MVVQERLAHYWHTTGHREKTAGRVVNIRRVASNRKPGKIQTRIYSWLLQREEAIRTNSDARALEEFEKFGVPWHPDALFNDHASGPSNTDRVGVSKALRGLREEGMVEARPKSSPDAQKRHRTSHVKLTQKGYVKAFHVTALNKSDNYRVPSLTLEAAKHNVAGKIRQYEKLGESIAYLLRASKATNVSLSLYSDDELARLISGDLRQIALWADQARKASIEDLKANLKQLDRLSH